MIPDTDVARVQRWARDRIPEDVRDQVWIELDVSDRAITILECRPSWNPDLIGADPTRCSIARLRYTKKRQEWSLFWRDRDLKFHAYDLANPSAKVVDLLDEIDLDRTGIFWG